MEEIDRLLKLFGLNEKEIKFYVACLQLGQNRANNSVASS